MPDVGAARDLLDAISTTTMLASSDGFDAPTLRKNVRENLSRRYEAALAMLGEPPASRGAEGAGEGDDAAR